MPLLKVIAFLKFVASRRLANLNKLCVFLFSRVCANLSIFREPPKSAAAIYCLGKYGDFFFVLQMGAATSNAIRNGDFLTSYSLRAAFGGATFLYQNGSSITRDIWVNGEDSRGNAEKIAKSPLYPSFRHLVRTKLYSRCCVNDVQKLNSFLTVGIWQKGI